MGAILKVTAKGQITLRKNLLDHLGVTPGDKIAVDFLPSGRAELRTAKPRTTIDEFIGCLRQAGGATLSVEEINRIAAAGWSGET